MNCPVCDERLREVEKYNVKVDICPGCKGVWLDRGELEKILEFAGSDGPRPSEGASRPSYDRNEEHERRDDREHHKESHDHHGEGYGGRRKKGSWLGEILGGFGED